MRKNAQRSAVMALVTLTASMLGAISPSIANAAVPTLDWPAVNANPVYGRITTSPAGDVTVGCNYTTQDLVTYNTSGAVVRHIPRTTQIDGVQNCIDQPVVDKNGDVYGIPYGALGGGDYGYGPNLLAYDGNTLKWKYAVACTNGGETSYVVGADGNIYTTARLGSGDVRLIGLAPELAAGQTQPTKVLDVDIPDDCSIKLREYKDGIFLHGQSSSYGQYVSYSGKALGQATIGDVWYEKINANGQLYVAQSVNGSYRSINVSMYDPLTGRVVWTTAASTQGANVMSEEVIPLAGNGLLVRLREQKMFGGAPALPTEYVDTLVTLNSVGQKIQAATLPNTDQNGNTYENTKTFADTSGKAIVVRDMWLKTTVSWPSTVAAIDIAVYDPATNTWPYHEVMSGNTNNANGSIYGYRQDYAGKNGPVVDTNTLFLKARCTESCSDYAVKLYPLTVTGIGMDYPRGEVLSANVTQPAPISYVDMGDSYSSGQGAGVYDSGTVTSTNKCYKSFNAYGRVSHRNPNSPLLLATFAACGGSVTDNIDQTGTYPGVPKQNTALTSTTQAVTITIGGNDIGFADVIKTCADPTKDCDGAYSLAANNLGVLDVKLQRVYLDILNKAPNAKVYVLGYPPIVTIGSGCLVGNNGSDYPFYSEDRKQKAVNLQSSLNTTIQNNVNTVRSINANYSQRLKFIDATAPGSPFIGHDVCSSEPYVNGLILAPGDSSESFHPNGKGHKAYADPLAVNLN